jgi:hypothetical protein
MPRTVAKLSYPGCSSSRVWTHSLLPLHPPSLPPSLGVPPSDADIAAGAARLTGDITQVPPMYSAVHHEGRRLYELAREGATVERAGRPVTITSFAVTRDPQDPRCLRFAVECRWVEGGGGGGGCWGMGRWALLGGSHSWCAGRGDSRWQRGEDGPAGSFRVCVVCSSPLFRQRARACVMLAPPADCGPVPVCVFICVGLRVAARAPTSVPWWLTWGRAWAAWRT